MAARAELRAADGTRDPPAARAGLRLHHIHAHDPPACPIGPQVTEQMPELVGDLDDFGGVHPKMVFDPPWSPEVMTEDAKFALEF